MCREDGGVILTPEEARLLHAAVEAHVQVLTQLLGHPALARSITTEERDQHSRLIEDYIALERKIEAEVKG